MQATLTQIQSQQATMLVAIDAGVEAPEALINGVESGAATLPLDPNLDAIAQITQALAAGNYTSLHLISHGSPGCLHLGSTPLSLETIARYRQQLMEWGVADLLVYGCRVAASPEFLEQLHALTGANIAASTHNVGKGNWHLEWQTGDITGANAFTQELQQQYPGEFATFTVDTLDDENDGVDTGGVSLRDAINAANMSPGDDVIRFNSNLSGGTINLTHGELRITDDLDIQGLGARNLTVDAGGNSRVFWVWDGNGFIADKTVTIDGLTITGGRLTDPNVTFFSMGAGILDFENLTISNSTIRGNQAASQGAGIANLLGTLNVTNSTISDNTARAATGIFINRNSTVTIANTTISGNTATAGTSAIGSFGTVILTNSTISNNSTPSVAVFQSDEASGSFNVTSTIIAGNSNNNDIAGTFTSGGNNLIGNGDGGSGFTNGSNGDIVGTAASPIDAQLEALANNGGPTDTHALGATSPALNAGSNPNSLTTDQNGNPRDDGNGVDIGAYEECFLTGTRILTDQGEIPVENLAIGDNVVTADGTLEPVKWIGIQTRQPHQVRNALRGFPILIKAGALGNHTPHRDLYVSPDHAMFFEGLLINAGALANGISILKTEPKEAFTYYHVELENHALLLAEGASAESYLPQHEDRLVYDNGAQYEELYPHGSKLMLWPLDYPRISSRNKVPRYLRQKLERIAQELGLMVKTA